MKPVRPELEDFDINNNIVESLPVEASIGGKYIALLPRSWNPKDKYIEEFISIIILVGVYIYFLHFYLEWSWLATILLGFLLLVPGIFALVLIGKIVEFLKKLFLKNYRNYLEYKKALYQYKKKNRKYLQSLFAEFPLTISVPNVENIKDKIDSSKYFVSEFGIVLEKTAEHTGGIYSERILPINKEELKKHILDLALVVKLTQDSSSIEMIKVGYMSLSHYQRIDGDYIEYPGKQLLSDFNNLEALKEKGLNITTEQEQNLMKEIIKIKEFEEYSNLYTQVTEESNKLLAEINKFIETIDYVEKMDNTFFSLMRIHLEGMVLFDNYSLDVYRKS